MDISVNAVVADITTGAENLVLWISQDKIYGYWHNLSGKSRTPVKFITGSIFEDRHEIDVLAIQPRPEETLSSKEREYRDKRWDLISQLVEYEPEIYEKESRLTLLREVSSAKNTTFSNLYKLLDCYWRSGKSKNGLLPLYSNCGAKASPKKKTAEKEVGKSRIDMKVLTDIDYSNFERAIRK